jgi:hypothetical protein
MNVTRTRLPRFHGEWTDPSPEGLNATEINNCHSATLAIYSLGVYIGYSWWSASKLDDRDRLTTLGKHRLFPPHLKDVDDATHKSL